MNVRNCTYPWRWMLVTDCGAVLPCGHGPKPVGHLREQSAGEIWNGSILREVRAAILAGEVHEVCRSTDCPYQQVHATIPEVKRVAVINESLARDFDEEWYLSMYPDAREAVNCMEYASGLEHYARCGSAEGCTYRLTSRMAKRLPAVANAALALVEYSRGATVIRSKPVEIVMNVTTICNLGCVMCPHGHEGLAQPRHMPFEFVERMQPMLDEAARMIVSGQGEPLVAPAFWQIVEPAACREDAFIRVNSNGYYMTPENAVRILNSGLKEISFSLDAATSATYAKIRGGDFHRVLLGVATMCETRRRHPRGSQPHEKLWVFINMTLMIENIAEAPAFVELAHELGVDAVLFSQLFPFGDQPGWRVQRGGWTFVYSEQMLTRVPGLARKHLLAAQTRADVLGVKIVYQSKTELYLTASAGDGGGNIPGYGEPQQMAVLEVTGP